jgi:glucosamine-6-phosphate deaminase
MTDFNFEPSPCVPFRDKKVLDMARNISREDFLNHPTLDIRVIPDAEIQFMFVTDVFFRIKEAMDAGRRFVMIAPNPWPMYKQVAYLLNRSKVNCQNLYTFNMDEYADQDGNIAPESWPLGFGHAFKKYFYNELDQDLRPPEKQIAGPTNKNINDYGKMIADLGNADICYAGPGWTGHLAFVDPDAPEVPKDLESFKKMGPSVVTLSPFTLAQNSLHGSFGSSGDIAAVPPKAATIGPAEVLAAKHNLSTYCIGVNGTATSWQRLITRLSIFGPVTPLVPDSVLQLKAGAQYWVSENIAQKIEIDWNKGY